MFPSLMLFVFLFFLLKLLQRIVDKLERWVQRVATKMSANQISQRHEGVIYVI